MLKKLKSQLSKIPVASSNSFPFGTPSPSQSASFHSFKATTILIESGMKLQKSPGSVESLSSIIFDTPSPSQSKFLQLFVAELLVIPVSIWILPTESIHLKLHLSKALVESIKYSTESKIPSPSESKSKKLATESWSRSRAKALLVNVSVLGKNENSIPLFIPSLSQSKSIHAVSGLIWFCQIKLQESSGLVPWISSSLLITPSPSQSESSHAWDLGRVTLELS